MTRMTDKIELVTCGPGGQRCGQSHSMARHDDTTVELARALRAQGMTYPAIGMALGAGASTVASWCIGRRRRPPAKVVARRTTLSVVRPSFRPISPTDSPPKTADSFAVNHQRSGRGGAGVQADTVSGTDEVLP